MTPTKHLLSMAAAAALSTSAAAVWADPGTACTPPRLGPSVASVSEPWRRALEALRHETGAAGQPWGCAGGALDLVEHDGGARLTVTGDDGRTFSREVSAPDDLVPLGEAMLAKPEILPGPAPSPDAPPRDVAAPPAPGPVDASPPRVLLSALVAPRYAGGANVALGGITAAASIPFGAWLGGAWLRYDGVSAPLAPHGLPLTEICLGASGGRSFALGPVELRTSALASVAIVTRPGDPRNDKMPPNETHVDGRFGLDARGVIPITRMLRAVLALDADIDPREVAAIQAQPSMGMPSPRPGFPAYTLGVGVGMEIALR